MAAGGGFQQPADDKMNATRVNADHAQDQRDAALNLALREQEKGPPSTQKGPTVPGQPQPDGAPDGPGAKKVAGPDPSGDGKTLVKGDQAVSEVSGGPGKTDIHDKVMETAQFNPPPVNQANSTAFTTARQAAEAEGKVPVTPVSIQTGDNRLIEGAMRGNNTLVTAHGEYDVRPNAQNNGFDLYKRNEQGTADQTPISVRSMQPAQNPLEAHRQAEPVAAPARPEAPVRPDQPVASRVEPQATAVREPQATAARVEPQQLSPAPTAARDGGTPQAPNGQQWLHEYNALPDQASRVTKAQELLNIPPAQQAQFKSQVQAALIEQARTAGPEAQKQTTEAMRDLSNNVELARRQMAQTPIAQTNAEGALRAPAQKIEQAPAADVRQVAPPPVAPKVDGRPVTPGPEHPDRALQPTPPARIADVRPTAQPTPQPEAGFQPPPGPARIADARQPAQVPSSERALPQPQAPAARIAETGIKQAGPPEAPRIPGQIAPPGAPQTVAKLQEVVQGTPDARPVPVNVAAQIASAAQVRPEQLAAPGKDRGLAGTESDRGHAPEIRPVETAAQVPAGTSVRHVPFGDAQQDARVARLNTDQTPKAPTVPALQGRIQTDVPGRIADAGAIRPTALDIAARAADGRVLQPGQPQKPGDAVPGRSAAEVVAAKQGEPLKDATRIADRQLPPDLTAKLMEASNRGMLPSQMMTQMQDAAGKIQQQQAEGVLRQTQEHTTTAANIKADVARVGDATTVGRAVTDANAPIQRPTIPGLNLAEGQNRLFVNEVIKQIQTARLTEFDPRATNLQNILTNMDQARVTRIQAFLTNESTTTRTGTLTQEQMISKLNAALGTGSDITTRFGPGVKLDANALNMLTQGRVEQQGAITLANLIRMMDQVNRPVDQTSRQGPEMGLKDMVGRTLSDAPAGRSPMTLRLPPGQELAVKNFIDSKVLSTALPNMDLRTADGAKKLDVRPELPGKVDPREFVGHGEQRVDHAAQHPNTDQDKKDAQQTDLTKEQAEKLKDQREQQEERDREHKRKEEEEHKRKLEIEEKAKRDLLTAMATQKLRQLKDKELKDKLLAEQKKKDEDTKRRRYIVKEKDTLQSIALRQLRDVRLAPLIYQINRSVIPVTVQRGKQVHVLKVGQVILLPSGVEIRDFRAKAAGGTLSQPAPPKKFETAEDELAARFGANWDGQASAQADEPDEDDELAAEALAAAQARRDNVERLLGPVSKKEKQETRIRYVVRLGDSLKSVALKHPALKDVELWKLLAMVNGLSMDVDMTGAPTTALSRGSTLVIPTAAEVSEFKEHLAQMQNEEANPFAESDAPAPAPPPILEKIAAQPDAGTIILQAAGFISDDLPVETEETFNEDDDFVDEDDESADQ